MKKILTIFLTTCFFLMQSTIVLAQSSPVTLEFFWAEGCPHCAKEKLFLSSIADKYPSLEIKSYEISQNYTNALLLSKRGRELKADVSGVPFTIIGKEYITGFASSETTGKHIESLIQKEIGETKAETSIVDTYPTVTDSLSFPLLGTIQLKNLSLPVLTVLIALMDGFNPCAMWTLLFLISLLLGMKDRKRMWILGSAFIVTSALVYFMFLSAWLNLFLFLGLIVWVRLIIAGVALAAGFLNLRSYVSKKTGCEVMGDAKRQAVFAKLKAIASNKQFGIALGGIVLLAIAVNLVELICSAGLPAVYTQILSLSALPSWQYYLYLLFYVLIFMMDDLFIFFTAMITLQAVGIQSKYSRLSKLVGGIAMLIIGILLLIKPELLMFG